MGEVYYAIWRAHGEKAALAKRQRIAQLPIEVSHVDMELTRLAASLKAQHILPHAHGFAAALAPTTKATLVTNDMDFQRADVSLKILWV